MLVLPLVAAALAVVCTDPPPPHVMGAVEVLDVPPVPVLHVAWAAAPDVWPPDLVLVAGTEPDVLRDLGAVDTMPLVFSAPRVGPDAVRPAVSADARPARPLPPGTTWRVYRALPTGWIAGPVLRVSAADRPPPAWTAEPAHRTGLPARLEDRPDLGDWHFRDTTGLVVDGTATSADFLAAWAGRVGTPIDYTRPPDFVAARDREGFVIGAVVVCAPRTLTIPANGGDDFRYGLRPLDTAGRFGPAVEVDLVEARRAEAEARARLVAARHTACEDALPDAIAAWSAAYDTALAALLAEAPGCVDALGAAPPPGLEVCAGRPAFERLRAVDAVAAGLRTARTPAAVVAALTEGSALPEAWRPDTTPARAACAAVPAEGADRAW